jgi:hypothetical protein
MANIGHLHFFLLINRSLSVAQTVLFSVGGNLIHEAGNWPSCSDAPLQNRFRDAASFSGLC